MYKTLNSMIKNKFTIYTCTCISESRLSILKYSLYNFIYILFYFKLIRKDIGWNEDERLINYSILHLKIQIKVKEEDFYYCSTFHSHIRIINNELITYNECGTTPNMHLSDALYLSVNARSGPLYHYNVIQLGYQQENKIRVK
jgi:hypothetical protein